jgi:hypothetical protein
MRYSDKTDCSVMLCQIPDKTAMNPVRVRVLALVRGEERGGGGVKIKSRN